jgi:hypothetical protein
LKRNHGVHLKALKLIGKLALHLDEDSFLLFKNPEKQAS